MWINSQFVSCAVLFIKLSICYCSVEIDEISLPARNEAEGISERSEYTDSDESTFPSSSEDNLSTLDETQEITTEVVETTTNNTTTTRTKERNFTFKAEYIIKDICANFIYAGPIVLNKMVDMWQTAYYRASEKVPCFKMFIRKLTMKEKQFHKQKYGNFDDAVEWEDCNLEIRSSMEVRKHFLQGCEKGHGVLENIIIGQRNVSDFFNTSNYYLKPESPGQWLVVQNLLLKRNCDTGDVTVFSRVPHKPRNQVIEEALKLFGEKSADGKFVCGDQPPIKKKPYEVDEEVDENI